MTKYISRYYFVITMKKVLWITDPPFMPSGYGRVLDNFIKLNRDKYEIHCLGLPFIGNPIKYNGATIWGKGIDRYGMDVIPYLIKKINPHYIITLCDIGYQEVYHILPKIKKKGLWNGEWVAYSPIDTLDGMSWMKEILDEADIVVTMSKYGQKIMSELNIKDGDVKYVPHGVDISLYKPLKPSERKQLRENNGYSGKFVVLSVGKNQVRKAWDRLIKGFAKFVHDNNIKDALFLMHTDKEGSDLQGHDKGFMINMLAEKYNIRDYLRFTDPQLNKLWRNYFSEEMLVRLYQLADVGLYNGAEGFGIPMLEQQACGRPNIVGKQTSAIELNPYGKLVEVDSYIEGCVGVATGLISVDGIAQALKEYYDDRRKLSSDGRKCCEFVKNYEWKKVNKYWEKILE